MTFSLLTISAIFSPLFKNINFLKIASIILYFITFIFLLSFADTGLKGFYLSESIRFFEVILLFAATAITLSAKDKNTITQLIIILTVSFLLLESRNLVSFVITFEALSIISFVLVSNMKTASESEGAIKMFIAGAVASGIILMGLAIFILSSRFIELQIISIFLIILGIFYKMSVIPLHSWASDTYSKVSPINAGILSGMIKSVVVVASVDILMPFFSEFEENSELFIYAFGFFAVITMTIGNFLAVFQKKISKILAYSSIAHSGYMLIPFASFESNFAFTGLVYLAIAYIFTQTALFMVLEYLKVHKIENLEDLKNLHKKDNFTALIFTLQLFSLAGIPLLAGFMSKAVAFYSGIDAGLWWLVAIALFNSAFSVAYYIWIMKNIYFESLSGSDSDEVVEKISISNQDKTAQIIFLFGTILFGIFAFPILMIF